MAHKIGVIAAGWMGDLLTFVAPAPRAEAGMVRAQVHADPVRIARAVIAQKALHSKVSGMIGPSEYKAIALRLRRCETVSDVIWRKVSAQRSTGTAGNVS